MSPTVTAESVLARRAQTDDLVCGMPGHRDRDLAFDEPWQIRAFAIAVGAHASGEFEWPVFQDALIDSIRSWEARTDVDDTDSWSYYEHWVRALEEVLGGVGAVDSDDLDAKTQEVLATPANRGHHDAHLEPVAIDPAVRTRTP